MITGVDREKKNKKEDLPRVPRVCYDTISPSGSLLIFQYSNREEQQHCSELDYSYYGVFTLCICMGGGQGQGLAGSFSPGNPVVHRLPNVHREPGVSGGDLPELIEREKEKK